MEVVKELREKIKEYHEALLLQRQICDLDRPQKRTVEAYRTWFDGEERTTTTRDGETKATLVPVLGGPARSMLDEQIEPDLVALRPPSDRDALSTFLMNNWPARVTYITSTGQRIAYYKERSIAITVGVVSTLMAAMLLVGSVAAFFYVKRQGVQLGMLGGFTAAFALSVALLTNARRVELFAATAA
ncbi:hypothetical protein BT63DRAFT_286018 [Microthyrium microscopicum]|uniref:DUF6594 domain-containing protein n=1 Tax=Microthyrium microscopicum TaxID=703497 RepID=A0A6A6UB41_9PEZI|nr:hypothetical protein BT63DRAFT_286018 [Microthyrium microscopicum]